MPAARSTKVALVRLKRCVVNSLPRRDLHEHPLAKLLEIYPNESADVVPVHCPIRDAAADRLDRDSELPAATARETNEASGVFARG